MTTSNHADRVADILRERQPGSRKLYRFDDEALVRSKNPSYIPFAKKPKVRKQIDKLFGVEVTKKPSKRGDKLLGYRESGWRRPFMAKGNDGKFRTLSANAVEKLWN